MVDYINRNAYTNSTGQCSASTRKSIEYGLGKQILTTNHAKDYNPILLNIEFQRTSINTTPIFGDIIFFGANKKSESGHIQMLTSTG